MFFGDDSLNADNLSAYELLTICRQYGEKLTRLSTNSSSFFDPMAAVTTAVTDAEDAYTRYCVVIEHNPFSSDIPVIREEIESSLSWLLALNDELTKQVPLSPRCLLMVADIETLSAPLRDEERLRVAADGDQYALAMDSLDTAERLLAEMYAIVDTNEDSLIDEEILDRLADIRNTIDIQVTAFFYVSDPDSSYLS